MSDAQRRALFAAYRTTGQASEDESAPVPAIDDLLGRHVASVRGPVLDVGCGAGQLLQVLEARGTVDAEGIEISEEQAELARTRTGRPVLVGDFRDLLAERVGRYGLITAIDVLEHLDPSEVVEALRRIHDALRPGGVLLARSPNGASPLAGRLRYGDLTHGLAFTATSCRQACTAAGFAAVEVHPVRISGRSRRAVVRRVAWRAIEAGITAYNAVETGRIEHGPWTQNLVLVARRA